jgi:hypothetical protein
MKKIAMLLFGMSMAFMSPAQTMEKSYYNYVSGADTIKVPVKKSRNVTNGKTPYIYAGVGASMPPYSYGYSFEAGLWGIESPISFGLTADIGYSGSKSNPSTSKDTILVDRKMTHWIGFKVYGTVYQNKSSCYMVYIAPKTDVTHKLTYNLVEIGINPNYTINKHMLMSISLSDQIYNDGNKFDKSIWHPGIGVGLVIYK